MPIAAVNMLLLLKQLLRVAGGVDDGADNSSAHGSMTMLLRLAEMDPRNCMHILLTLSGPLQGVLQPAWLLQCCQHQAGWL